MKSRLFLCCLFIATLSFGQTGSWDFDKTPIPVKTAGSSAHYVDGKIFVIGGWTALPEKPDSIFAYSGIQVYDPVLDIWDTTRTEMPNPRYNSGSAVVGTKIYIFGGNPLINAFDAYDTATDAWDTELAGMPHGNTGCQAVAVDELIYIAGAWSHDKERAEYFGYYDPATDQFTKLDPLPYPVGHSSLEVIGHTFYVIGGINTQINPVGPIDKIQTYSIGTGEWEVMDCRLPDPYWAQGSFRRDSLVYLFGAGGQYSYETELTEVYGDMVMVDLQNKVCRKIGTYPYDLTYPEIIDLGAEVLCIGGFFSDDEQLSAMDKISRAVFGYYPVEYPVYPVNVTLASSYCTPGDSVLINCNFVNTSGSSFYAAGNLLNQQGEIKDTFNLYDDGLHCDQAANDGYFGGYFLMEEEYLGNIGINCSVSEINDEFVSLELLNVTSIGPVIFAGTKFFSADTIPDPGDVLKVRPCLRNNGKIASAKDITASFFSCSEQLIIQNNFAYMPDLLPNGEREMGLSLMTLRISEDCIAGQKLEIAIDIYSGGTLFWRDTAVIIVGQGFSTGMINHNMIDQDILVSSFPNPFIDWLTIEYDNFGISPISLEILNISGQIKHSSVLFPEHKGENIHRMDLTFLPRGAYIIRMRTDHQMSIKMVIKN